MKSSTRKHPPKEEQVVFPCEKSSIYRTIRQTLCDVNTIAAHMPAKFKYILGRQLIIYAMQVAENIALAYEAEGESSEELEFIMNIRRTLHRLLITTRTGRDVGAIPGQAYTCLVATIVSAINQAEGWRRSTEAKIAQPGG